MAYEKQPQGSTFFWSLDQSKRGGDKQFARQVEARKRFSAALKKRFEELAAIYSTVPQAYYSGERGGPGGREPIEIEVSATQGPVHLTRGRCSRYTGAKQARGVVQSAQLRIW